MIAALRRHGVEYLAEALSLGLFMLSASGFATLLEHPDSPARAALGSQDLRRTLMGLAMGGTALALIHSPWGRRSGAHMNPAVTLSFWFLRKVETVDAVFYVLSQIAGGVVGMFAAWMLVGGALADPSVRWVVTVPGPGGVFPAFVAEATISFLLMTSVLVVSNNPRTAPFTGWVAAFLVASFITFEAPLSGMSMNPARTLASAVAAGEGTALWVYLAAPSAAMLAASAIYRAAIVPLGRKVYCAKLHHDSTSPCPFRCGYMEAEASPLPAPARVS